MIHYKDKTFCHSDCVNTKCYRFFGQEEKDKAEKWWGGKDYPVALCDFSQGCEDYQKP